MQVTRLKLKNFCQHQDREFHFGPGITAILGPNGSGKSNVLGAIRFLFTGVNPNHGSKSDNVYDLASPEEAAFAECEFSHNGTQYLLRRTLRKVSPTALLEGGGLSVRGEIKVTEALEELLGASAAVMNELVIVAQSEIFSVLTETEAKRAATLQRLFQVDICAKIHKALGEHLQAVPQLEVAADLDHLRGELALASQSFAVAQQKLADAPTDQAIMDGLAAARAVLQSCLNRRATAAIIRTQEQIAAECTQRQAITYEAFTQAKAAAAERAAAVSGAEAKIQQLKQEEAEAAKNAEILQAKRQTTEQIAALRRQQDAIVMPTAPDDFVVVEEATHKLHQKQNEHVVLLSRKAFLEKGYSKCPTCDQPVPPVEDELQQVTAALAGLDAVIPVLHAAIAHSTKHTADVQAYANELRQVQASLEFLERQLIGLPDVPDVAIDAKAVTEQLAAMTGLVAAAAAAVDFAQGKETELAEATRDLERATWELAKSREALAAAPDTPAEREHAASAAIGAWTDWTVIRKQLERSEATAEAEVAALQRSIADTERAKAKARRTELWRENVQLCRQVFHHSEAPKAISLAYMQRISGYVNELLETFAANYRVEANSRLGFTATFPTGVKQDVERLSWGQKVTLAVAFRFALNQLFAGQVGALYLDEPTVYQDEKHIAAFGPVVSKMSQLAGSRDMQCFIITHERDLAPLFDSVVQVA